MFTTALEKHKEKYERIGIEKGIERKVLEDAGRMLEKGLSVDLVIDITELSRETVENLKSELSK